MKTIDRNFSFNMILFFVAIIIIERKKKPAPIPPNNKRMKPVPSPRTVQDIIDLKTPTIKEAEEIENSPKKGNQHFLFFTFRYTHNHLRTAALMNVLNFHSSNLA